MWFFFLKIFFQIDNDSRLLCCDKSLLPLCSSIASILNHVRLRGAHADILRLSYASHDLFMEEERLQNTFYHIISGSTVKMFPPDRNVHIIKNKF